MKELAKFISILELTREQPQYGYFLGGIHKEQTSNLAEHHYLVTMIGYMLCEHLNETERLIDTEKVIKMCLVHDLGELFGGDIAGPLSRKYPELKVHARAIEKINLGLITAPLRESIRRGIEETFGEAERKETDEAVVAKIADLIETHFFLEHRGNDYPHKDAFYDNHIRPLALKIKNEKIRLQIEEFFQGFEEHVKGKGFTASNWILG